MVRLMNCSLAWTSPKLVLHQCDMLWAQNHPHRLTGVPAAVLRPGAQQGFSVEMKARLPASARSQEENEAQGPALGAALSLLPAFASQVLFSVE